MLSSHKFSRQKYTRNFHASSSIVPLFFGFVFYEWNFDDYMAYLQRRNQCFFCTALEACQLIRVLLQHIARASFYQCNYITSNFYHNLSLGNAKCKDLKLPLHGIALKNNKEIAVNAVEVKCNSGYRLVGSKWRFCTNSGKWSGLPSRCEGMTFHWNKRQQKWL